MEIGYEKGRPQATLHPPTLPTPVITFGLPWPQLGLVIWETVAQLRVQAHLSAGVSGP